MLKSTDKELVELIKEELNVKEIKIKKGKKLSASFDFRITKKLRKEGLVREITRTIQGMRKEGKFKKEEEIKIFYTGDKNLETIIEDNNGNLWFRTENGVNKFNGKSFTYYTEKNGLNRSISH